MIREIRIDEALWERSSALRREDWIASIRDLLHDGHLGKAGDHTLVVRAELRAIVCTVLDPHGAVRATHTVSADDLGPHVEEYFAVIRKLRAGGEHLSSARMTAFDMAKKVVHDGAARTLARTLPGLAHDHATYRRLFSLFFSLVVDVTKHGMNAHRRHGR